MKTKNRVVSLAAFVLLGLSTVHTMAQSAPLDSARIDAHAADSIRSMNAGLQSRTSNLQAVLRGKVSTEGSEGEAEDYFGSRVELSGDVAAIFASGEGIFGRPRGAVYLYRWTGSSWTFESKIQAPEGGGADEFGNSIALEGHFLLVSGFGPTNPRGVVYVFEKQGADWSQTGRLTAPGAEPEIRFGASLAIKNGTAVIGAPRAAGGRGRVYVFGEMAGQWQSQGAIESPLSEPAGFSDSIAFDGDYLAVSALWEDDARGAVYVYRRAGVTWQLEQRLVANDREARDVFGADVAIHSESLLIGAHGDDIGPNLDQGSAYVFSRESGAWVQQQKLVAFDGGARRFFGRRVALDGHTAVVSGDSIFESQGSVSLQGAAYVYSVASEAWDFRQKINSGIFQSRDAFSSSIALTTHRMLLGCVACNVGPNQAQGRVHSYSFADNAWRPEATISTGKGAKDAAFGSSLALDRDRLLVGAVGGAAQMSEPIEGAYLFSRTGGSWALEAILSAEETSFGDLFGTSLALAGDLAIVGAPTARDDRGILTGAVYVFERLENQWINTAKLTPPDGSPGDYFGTAIALDGSYMAVGSPDHSNEASNEGAVYIFRFEDSQFLLDAKLAASGPYGIREFGSAIDLQGDRMIVGAPWSSPRGRPSQGSAFVFERIDGTWNLISDLSLKLGEREDLFGTSVALGPDFALVSAIGRDVDGIVDQGVLYAFTLGKSGWSLNHVISAVDPRASDFFGSSMSLAAGNLAVGVLRFPEIGPYFGNFATYQYSRYGNAWVLRDISNVPIEGVHAFSWSKVETDGRGTQVLGVPGAAGEMPFGNNGEGVTVISSVPSWIHSDGFE